MVARAFCELFVAGCLSPAAAQILKKRREQLHDSMSPS